jgi:hypothetical protein
MKTVNRPASSGRVLSVRPEESGLDALDADSLQNREDISRLEQDQAEAKQSDKIGSIVGYGPYDIDQSPTQVFGMPLIDRCKGDVDKIPNWKFSRWYYFDKIIVDLFYTDQAYKEADVEARRKMAKSFRFKYAALGPGMSYRTNLPAQLGIRG